MSIYDIERAKELQHHGKRLGRNGISQRVNDLVLDFAKKYPAGNYREGIMLAGRLHALFLATDPHDYWREVAGRGLDAEYYDIKKYRATGQTVADLMEDKGCIAKNVED